MWPSQQQNKPKTALQTLHNRLNDFADDDGNQSGDLNDDDSKAEVAIVWPSATRQTGVSKKQSQH